MGPQSAVDREFLYISSGGRAAGGPQSLPQALQISPKPPPSLPKASPKPPQSLPRASQSIPQAPPSSPKPPKASNTLPPKNYQNEKKNGFSPARETCCKHCFFTGETPLPR